MTDMNSVLKESVMKFVSDNSKFVKLEFAFFYHLNFHNSRKGKSKQHKDSSKTIENGDSDSHEGKNTVKTVLLNHS